MSSKAYRMKTRQRENYLLETKQVKQHPNHWIHTTRGEQGVGNMEGRNQDTVILPLW